MYDYYLSNIITILSETVIWKNLKISINYKNIKKYHYKTINTIHLLWSKIFRFAPYFRDPNYAFRSISPSNL